MVVVKRPCECASQELRNFASLVRVGGEVTATGLEARISRAEALCFLFQDTCLKGITAVKTPSHNYKDNVFRKARASIEPSSYPLEIGWVFVLPSSRGSGLSHKLVQAAIGFAGDRACFATSRSDNEPMHKVLCANGFQVHGESYTSEHGSHHLVLLAKSAQQSHTA